MSVNSLFKCLHTLLGSHSSIRTNFSLLSDNLNFASCFLIRPPLFYSSFLYIKVLLNERQSISFLFFSYTRHSISLWMISVIWYVFTLVNLFKNKPSYLRFNYAIGLVQMSKFPVNHSVWSSVWTTMMLCNIWKSSRTFDQTSLRVVH